MDLPIATTGVPKPTMTSKFKFSDIVLCQCYTDIMIQIVIISDIYNVYMR